MILSEKSSQGISNRGTFVEFEKSSHRQVLYYVTVEHLCVKSAAQFC